jgi:hypothetical protein
VSALESIRVPIGIGNCLKVLDYVAATPGCISKVWGTWHLPDHAMIIAETRETGEERWSRTTLVQKSSAMQSLDVRA